MSYSRLILGGTALLFAAACTDAVPTGVSPSRTPVASLTTAAVTGLLVDQQNTGPFEFDLGINAGGGIAQGFTAGASNLGAVDLFLTGSGSTPATTLTVNIRTGTYNSATATYGGVLLGTTTVAIPAGLNGTPASPTEVQAVFATAIPLMPGAVYYIQIDPDGGRFGAAIGGDTYAGGIAYQGDFAIAGRDIGFRTYSRAVEPIPQGPTTQEQCKEGGWAMFTVPRTFRNQGDCVSFVVTGK